MNEAEKKDGLTIFITGGAGYVGEMLAEQFLQRDDVATIIVLDKEPQSDYAKEHLSDVVYIKHNMADDGWQEEVAAHEPDIVIHTAWQIRMMYGQFDEEWRWNVEGSNKVFAFAFATPSVKKLIHYSTASSYAAKVDNTLDHRFTEAEGFREDGYLYAKEKKVAEENLKQMYDEMRSNESRELPQVTVFRPAAITGPRGRFMRIRFGLQSALQGNLSGGFVNRIVTLLTSFVPATNGWVRQFIHEDDVADATAEVVFNDHDWEYEVFNLTPNAEPVYPKDMAKAVGKRILPIQPWMARLAFWFFWHTTRGKIPTAPHSWRFYSYPIVMSGDKLARVYTCAYTSKDAFQYTDGRYEDWVPEEARKPKP